MDKKKTTSNENEFTERGKDAMKNTVKNMKQMRQDKGLTQQEMADKIGISVQYLRKIEQNKCKLPAYIVYEYSRILHVSVETLYGFARPPVERARAADIIRETPSLPQDVLQAIWSLIQAYYNK